MSIFVRNGDVAAKIEWNALRAVVVRNISADRAVSYLLRSVGMS